MGAWRKLVGVALALALLAGGCAADAPQDTLDPAGPYAEQIDNLFMPVVWVAVAVFVLVEGVIVFAVIRWRRRPDDDDDELPVQLHGSTKLEIGWTVLPALVLGLIAVFTIPVIFDLNEKPAGALEVDVTGQKYWWGFDYPEGQTDFGISEGIVTANELHIPAGEPVYLTMTATDVIHSFWAPRLNGKRDVVPGREHTWSLEADEPGAYSGQCAEFCGTSHANMRLKVVAHDPASWEDWVSEMQTPPLTPLAGAAAEGFELFQQRGCAACHRIEGAYETVAPDSPSAPDLTHLFTRDCFAGCIYDLNDRAELEAWLRNPQRKAGSLMVIGELTEDDIDSLYAYLETLE
ncbi:MAG: cytochrome c oxidase subunit II [Acidimicrobiia bacterium]|jgi:cytochrome c oxidase subunit 2|nr:cytochrome c oxidase subunit II [Acidimicrobiia bacterium]